MTEVTEETIRERLAADKKKTSRLAAWEEIEDLLGVIDRLQEENKQLREAEESMRIHREWDEREDDEPIPSEWVGQ